MLMRFNCKKFHIIINSEQLIYSHQTIEEQKLGYIKHFTILQKIKITPRVVQIRIKRKYYIQVSQQYI